MCKLHIVGMCHPQHADDERALWPAPVGVAGWRLWRMAHERTGVTRWQWICGTERTNLCTLTWDRGLAIERARALVPRLEGHTALLLGIDVVAAFRAIVDAPLLRPLEPLPGRPWFDIPHPSGLNRWYNDAAHRVATELLLEDLVLDHEMMRLETGEEREEWIEEVSDPRSSWEWPVAAGRRDTEVVW